MKTKVRKIILTMWKCAIYGMIIHISFYSFAFALNSEAQKKSLEEMKTSIGFEETRIQSAFDIIENATDFTFAYRTSEVRNKRITIEETDRSLGELLRLISIRSGLSFRSTDGTIHHVKPAQKEEEQVVEITDQGVTVSGKVVDENNEPLVGANVIIKGTSSGTVTDIEGNFRLSANETDTLIFSFIGYDVQEIPVNKKTTINVSLIRDTQSLNEIIVVGYGTQEKKEVTSAISQVSSEEINKSSSISVSNALAGRVPGLIVNQHNAEPGRDDASVFVRGVGTTGDNSALIVVDGVANRDGISRIDPNDIESITVLKDASAAIYGAQAGNGVILITTKRGVKGKPRINYSFRQGFVSPTRKLDVADAGLYSRSVNIWAEQQGLSDPIFTNDQIAGYESGALPSTDWIEEIYKSYSVQNRHNVSMSGGSEAVKYFISTGTAYQNGLVTGDNTTRFRQYNVRSNIDAKIGDQITLALDLAGRHEQRRWLQYSDNTIYSNTVRAIPTIPATIEGLPAEGRQGFNPLAIAKGPGYLNLERNVLQGTLKGEYKIPGIKGLALDGFAAVDIFQDFYKHFFQKYTYYRYNDNDELEAVEGGPSQVNTYLREDYDVRRSVTLNAKIKYDRSFGDHSINAFLAYEQNETTYDTLWTQANNFASSQIDQLFAGDASSVQNYGAGAEFSRQNYFGRLSYSFRDKYLFQFHFRRDGSSRFPEGRRFGFFPGVSAGWRISEESFLKGKAKISNLKLRASWGELGNDRIAPFQYLNIFNYPDRISLGYVFGGQSSNVLNPGVLANSNITWETKSTLDLGMDAGFFKDKLTLEFDVFFEKRNDILEYRNATVPDYTGISLPRENIGKIENRGFDGVLTFRNRIGELFYSIGRSITFVKSKVTFLDEKGLYENEEDYKRQSREGHVVGAPLLYSYIGVYRTQDDIDRHPVSYYGTPRFGDPIFEDINNDGVIDALDRKRLNKTGLPQIQYGIPVGLEYKGFDFSLLFQGQAHAWQLLRYTFNNGNNAFSYFLENAWSEGENPDGSLPAFNRGNSDDNLSTLWLRNVSFLRLKNIELGYTIPKELVARIGVENLRVYFNGYNILTFDKLKKDGLPDPESVDIEGWQFPLTKSVNFGLNVTL